MAPITHDAFLSAIAAKGLRFEFRNGALWLSPREAYRTLTADEQAYWRVLRSDDYELRDAESREPQPESRVSVCTLPPDKVRSPASSSQSSPVAEEPAPGHFTSVKINALPRHLWPEVGLYEINDIVTHTLGDAYAAQILSGEVDFAKAKTLKREAEEQLSGIKRARRR